MFDFLTKPIENILNIADGLLDGELPSKRQVASLISAGVTIAVIADVLGVTEDVIRDLIDE